jgi:hypothetical protein
MSYALSEYYLVSNLAAVLCGYPLDACGKGLGPSAILDLTITHSFRALIARNSSLIALRLSQLLLCPALSLFCFGINSGTGVHQINNSISALIATSHRKCLSTKELRQLLCREFDVMGLDQ